jgi:hypothetical protein
LSQTNVQQSCGPAHALPAGWHPLPVPPVPVLVPPVPVLVPPVPVLAPLVPELAPLAPPVFDAVPTKPPVPELSAGMDELPPHVTIKILENNNAAPATKTRWIM